MESTSRSGTLLFLGFIGITFVGAIVFSSYYFQLRRDHALDPVTILGAPVQAPFGEAQAFRAGGGVTSKGSSLGEGFLVELQIPSVNSKLSLLLAEAIRGASAGSVSDVFPKVRAYRIATVIDDGLTPLALSFLSAQFDARRAKEYEKLSLSVHGAIVAAERVAAKNEEFFLFGVINRPTRQIAFSFLTKDKPLDEKQAALCLEALPVIADELAIDSDFRQ